MARDDDRLDGRLDEDQERLVEAAKPHGFELRQPRKRPFEEFGLEAFEAPDTVLSRLSGEIDGAKVDVFEYDWAQAGAKGAVTRGRRIVTLVRHPGIDGDARCRWEPFQTITAKVLIGLLMVFVVALIWWLVIPIWLYQWYQGKDPLGRDLRVGDREFDKRFKVEGGSQAGAERALPRALQELAVRMNMRGPIEVKPGLLAISHEGPQLEPALFERALAVTREALATYVPKVDAPQTAYRVASDVARELPEELIEDERSPATLKK